MKEKKPSVLTLWEHLTVTLSLLDVPDYVKLEKERWQLVTVYLATYPPGANGKIDTGRTFVFKREVI